LQVFRTTSKNGATRLQIEHYVVFFESTQEFPLTLRDCGFTLLKIMTLPVDKSSLLEAICRK
jgi:hypothetical protein